MLGIVGLLALAAVGTAVVWVGSTRLEASANRLALAYGFPAVVQGAIIAAVGSSMPELVSVIVATLRYDEFELGIGAIVGSAVFNLLVIPGLAALVNGGIPSSREIVYKEALFYMLSVAALLLTFSLAVVYFPYDGTAVGGTVTRSLALFPLGLYGLYLFIQYLDVSEHDADEYPEIDRLRNWLIFFGGIVVIVVGVEALVWAAVGLGEEFGTPAFLWGLTVVAAGTSLPDAFVSIAAARAERPTVSLANVLGSNVFDLLVAIPIGVLIAGALAVNFAHVAPMMAFLVLSTVAFFMFARTDMHITRREAWAMLALYGVFVLWLIAESIGLTGIIAPEAQG